MTIQKYILENSAWQDVLLKFLEYARNHGFKHKIAGDWAYSKRPMGMGDTIKLISAKDDKILVYQDKKGRFTI